MTKGFKKGYTPWNKIGVYLNCVTCKSNFYVSPSRIKYGKPTFCSKICVRDTEEQKKVRSELTKKQYEEGIRKSVLKNIGFIEYYGEKRAKEIGNKIGKSNINGKNINCVFCNKEFYVCKFYLEKTRYCSRKCMGKHREGKPGRNGARHGRFRSTSA